MSVETSFRVEDFLEAITSQLDRTQDALRLKAVNRPLTYAIRDFSLDLKVFVEMDDEGQVRFRSTGPDDSGASTVSIAFTTITRPMIEENTIALTEVQSAGLDELGLEPDEQRALAKVGVRNAAQLKRLSSSSGEGALSKFANVPVNKLRAALQAARPRVEEVGPQPGSGNGSRRPTRRDSGDVRSIRVPRDTRRLRLDGSNLRGLERAGTASLDGVGVPIVAAEDDHLIVDIGDQSASGRLDVDLGDGVTLSFQLELDETSEGWEPE